jgi:carboxypeptidase C (cathepsin A)
MQRIHAMVLASILILPAAGVHAAEPASAAASGTGDASGTKTEDSKIVAFKPELQTSKGTVTVEGKRIDYDANAGTLVVHLRDYDDVPQNANKDDKVGPAEASMFYVAYFKSGIPSTQRPITFLYNGGPGSSTIWLHMGAFGPRRVVTPDGMHAPAAPYPLVNNDYSLLDATDLVFIDAPGTGFSRVAGKDHEKAFYGVDADAAAFADFIAQFLAKYGRWNSPKYLFGESYGTTRSGVLINLLESDRRTDFNGVILLSQALNFANLPDLAEETGADLPYVLALPTYSATAWYHHKLPDAPKELPALLADVEQFAVNDYSTALAAGANLDPQKRASIIAKLHQYTGLPAAYIEKANLRVTAGEFEKTLQDDDAMTTGRYDSRFLGPTMDPLSKDSDYDPQEAAIGSAFVSAFNDYVRKDLKLGADRAFKPEISLFRIWNFSHVQPDESFALPQWPNVMPDLAAALKYNPGLKVMLNAGYYDLATPYYEGVYEMRHLPIPATLQQNIEFRFYESGHMVYAHEPSLKALHDNVADFIRRTDNLAAPQ